MDNSQTSYSFPLSVEVSTPTASAVPDRPPDANGWYNHPVSVSMQGNAFSLIASCTPAQTYAGPDSGTVTMSGTCTDNAGKTAGAALALRYDATPPSLTAGITPADGSVDVQWRASAGPAPLTSLQVVRRPGIGRSPSRVVARTASATYRDTQVRNGVTYSYVITGVDQAGNVTTRTLTATPGRRLLAPSSGARVMGAPLLRWTAIPGAAYYNVQLYRGHKLLSVWPRHPTLQLRRAWSFAGRRHRLTPGRYRWYVWPGFGPKARARYGRLVGSGAFIVREP
ncbi:MAG: hypothetical protein WBQ18_17700 [Solirubrobacteraceae bacterium]